MNPTFEHWMAEWRSKREASRMNEERQKLAYEFADDMFKRAQEVKTKAEAKGEEFCHLAAPCRTSDFNYGLIPLSGDRGERRREIAAIHRTMKDLGYDCLVIISDSWTTSLPKGLDVDEFMRRREAGEKFERNQALTMIVCGQDIIPRTTSLSYTVEGRKVKFGELRNLFEFESWMVPKEWAPLPVSKGRA